MRLVQAAVALGEADGVRGAVAALARRHAVGRAHAVVVAQALEGAANRHHVNFDLINRNLLNL